MLKMTASPVALPPKSIETTGLRPAFIFLLLAALFCVLRALPILTAIELISNNDELDLGFIAKEWLTGLKLPIWHYQMDSYGESLLMGSLCAVSFKLLGPTLFALKIPFLLFGLLSLGLLFLLVFRHFGLKKAAAVSLLLIFSAPSHVQLSLTGMTGHTETNVFTLAMLFSFYEFFYRKKNPLFIFYFGLTGGLGFWFYHESIVMILTCLFCWWILDRKSFTSRLLLLFAAGLAVGLLPWFGYNAYHHAKGAHFVANAVNALDKDSLEALLKKALRLFFRGIPFSFNVLPVFGIHEKIFSVFYALPACLPLVPILFQKSWQIIREREDKEKMLPFLIFPFFFVLIFIVSSFDVDYRMGHMGFRYLRPLHFFLIPLFVLGLPSTKLKKVLFSTLLALGLAGQTNLFFQEPFGRAFHYKGYSFFHAGAQLRPSLFPHIRKPEDLSEVLSRWNPQDAYFFLWGISNAAFREDDELLLPNVSYPADETFPHLSPFSSTYLYEWLGSHDDTYPKIEGTAEKFEEDQRSYIYKGFYKNKSGHHRIKSNDCAEGPYAEWACKSIGRQFYFEFYKESVIGLNRSFLGDFKTSGAVEILDKIRNISVPDEKKRLLFKGLGMTQGWLSVTSNVIVDRPFQQLLDNATEKERYFLYEGLGWALKAMFREDATRVNDRLSVFPPEAQPFVRQGIQKFDAWYQLN